MPIVMPAQPPWRRLLVAAIALPVLVVLAVLAFAWPAARLTPREVPVGIVGAGPAASTAVQHIATAEPGAYAFRLYADLGAAQRAIRDRDVYGALAVSDRGVTVYVAGTAGPTVAQLLSGVGAELAAHGHVAVTTVDVVPLPADDPHGVVFSSALLPLTICGVIVAAAVSVLFGLRPAWRQLLALAVISSIAALGVYLVAQGFLGALPHLAFATWAALALATFAISAASAGLVALVGVPGLGLAAVVMVFLGNPFSAVTSAPELLPAGIDHLGQWLPPGAAANLLRSTAYFDGNGAGSHLAVLTAWALGGAIAIVVGHHTARRRVRAAGNESLPVEVAVAHHAVG